jgi:hypothetical protein
MRVHTLSTLNILNGKMIIHIMNRNSPEEIKSDIMTLTFRQERKKRERRKKIAFLIFPWKAAITFAYSQGHQVEISLSLRRFVPRSSDVSIIWHRGDQHSALSLGKRGATKKKLHYNLYLV